MAKEFKCKRCKNPINVRVPDSERTFINKDGDLFCSKFCSKNLHIPLSPKREIKKGKGKRSFKKKIEVTFVCGRCQKNYSYLTWNKVCSDCNPIVPENEKHLIRLYQKK